MKLVCHTPKPMLLTTAVVTLLDARYYAESCGATHCEVAYAA